MCSIRALIAAVVASFVMEFTVLGHCHAEKLQLFLDDNPRYPLIFGLNPHREYLDLESCRIISGDENNFEIYAEGIYKSTDVAVQMKETPTHLFRKNEESDEELQVWSKRNQEWKTIPNPYDQEAISEVLEETGFFDYPFITYYRFKCIYQHLFGKPYEDDNDELNGIDDEVLQHSALIPQIRETSKIRPYLWGDENFPLVWICHEWAWYLDESSIYVEMESPSKYILRVIAVEQTFLHYDDSPPRTIRSYRFLYDEDEGKMYKWSPKKEDWFYLTPNKNDDIYVGEAAFYLVYGEKFYDVSPRWRRKRNPWFNMDDEWFYERLDGETE